MQTYPDTITGLKKGFTFIEAMIIVALIGILVAILIPNYEHSVIRAREAVLKENLFQIRDALSKFYQDKSKYPVTLDELVGKYLRNIPFDPITKKREWKPIRLISEETEEYDPETSEGIIDVRSLSQKSALDGSNYSDW